MAEATTAEDPSASEEKEEEGGEVPDAPPDAPPESGKGVPRPELSEPGITSLFLSMGIHLPGGSERYHPLYVFKHAMDKLRTKAGAL